MMENNETGVKVPKGQINRLAPRKGNPVVEENPAAVGQQGQTMEG